MAGSTRKLSLLFLAPVLLFFSFSLGGELPDLGEPIGEEEMPFQADQSRLPEYEVQEYDEFLASLRSEWEKAREEAVPFLDEDGFIGEYKAPDPGALLSLIREEKKELRVERGQAPAAQGEMQLSDTLLPQGGEGYEVELVDKRGEVLKTYRYRRQSGAAMRDGAEDWVLEVADSSGKVISSTPLRGEERRKVRWEFGKGELASSAVSYRLRGVGGEAVEVSGSVFGLGEGKMFSLPQGKVVPALAGSRIDVLCGRREAVERLELAIIEKGKGKVVRRFSYAGKIPVAVLWDGRDEKGKCVRTDRDYVASGTAVDKHGIRQAVKTDIVRVPISVSGVGGGRVELCGAGVSFSYDEALVGRGEYARLSKVVEATKRRGVVVSVEGHTDCLGTDDYNERLSKKRALVVMKHLVRKEKVPIEKLRLKAHGRKAPRQSNLSGAGRQANRRVEFVLRLPLDKAGLSEKAARKMVVKPVASLVVKRGQKLAVMPFPAGKEAKSLERGLEVLFSKSDIFRVVANGKAGGNCRELGCCIAAGKKLKADWIFCATLSEEGRKQSLVLELVDVKSGRTLISDSLALGEGKDSRLALMRRLIKKVLANT